MSAPPAAESRSAATPTAEIARRGEPHKYLIAFAVVLASLI